MSHTLVSKINVMIDLYGHSGGLELLFSNQRNHKVSLPAQDQDGKPSNIAFLIKHLCENLMTDQKKELFLLDESVYVSSFHQIKPSGPANNIIKSSRHSSPNQRRRLGTRGRGPIRAANPRSNCLCIYFARRIGSYSVISGRRTLPSQCRCRYPISPRSDLPL